MAGLTLPQLFGSALLAEPNMPVRINLSTLHVFLSYGVDSFSIRFFSFLHVFCLCVCFSAITDSNKILCGFEPGNPVPCAGLNPCRTNATYSCGYFNSLSDYVAAIAPSHSNWLLIYPRNDVYLYKSTKLIPIVIERPIQAVHDDGGTFPAAIATNEVSVTLTDSFGVPLNIPCPVESINMNYRSPDTDDYVVLSDNVLMKCRISASTSLPLGPLYATVVITIGARTLQTVSHTLLGDVYDSYATLPYGPNDATRCGDLASRRIGCYGDADVREGFEYGDMSVADCQLRSNAPPTFTRWFPYFGANSIFRFFFFVVVFSHV
jgi:hypothetical protein